MRSCAPTPERRDAHDRTDGAAGGDDGPGGSPLSPVQSGLLPEPPRRDNGYRQYRASDLDRLIRIRLLGELGLSLADVRRLLDASPDERRAALQTLDDQYAADPRTLAERRGRLTELLAGPGDPTVPSPYREQAVSLRALGAPNDVVALDSALFRTLLAVTPASDRPAIDDALAGLTIEGTTALITADFMRRLADIATLAPDDPAVTSLVEDYAAFLRATWPELVDSVSTSDQPDDPLTLWAVNDLMAEHLTPTQLGAIRAVLAELLPTPPRTLGRSDPSGT